ncbi:MAG TPA: NAD(P)/FAD-dependent oxidoreductase [Gemmatimonadaceae bacterium]|nr:NAD(P)/FAD-dependent oxidoreductase [Gemmatimonadaceae bacterium]
MSSPIIDVAIVGGGPAGLSAALWLGRYQHSVVLVDSGDPRNWETRGIHGYLGLPDITPAELRGRGRDEARAYGARLIDGCVNTVERVRDGELRLTLEDETVIESRRLLLAIGIKDYWPQVPGLSQCYGVTAHHCPDCDGFEARAQKTVVIASGRSAVGMALSLATWTRQLVICTNGHAPDINDDNLDKLDALDIPVLTETIARALVDEHGTVTGLELANGFVLDCQQVFFSMGHYPADDLAVQLGCARDDEQLVIVDAHYHTSVPHVFAAGDIIPGPHLAVAAASDGAMAALSIHHSLLPEGLRLEPPAQRYKQ